jgi:hypothetical protein
MIPPPPSRSHTFNPPPGWPPPPPDWVPPTVPWNAAPNLPEAPEGWQWWIAPSSPQQAVQRGGSLSVWWRMQTRTVRRLIVVGVAFIAAALVLPHSAWFLSWHNNLSGGTFNISQAHTYCGNALVQAVTVPGSPQANNCATASDWSTFFLLLLFAGIALIIIAAYKIFQQHGTEGYPHFPAR